MKRWALTRMGDYEGDGGRVSKISQYPVNVRVWATPTSNWALAHFSAASLAAIQADAGIRVLPDATLDMLWGGLSTAVRNAATNAMQSAGYATSGIKTTMTVREVLHYIVHQRQPGINIEHGDVVDIEQ